MHTFILSSCLTSHVLSPFIFHVYLSVCGHLGTLCTMERSVLFFQWVECRSNLSHGAKGMGLYLLSFLSRPTIFLYFLRQSLPLNLKTSNSTRPMSFTDLSPSPQVPWKTGLTNRPPGFWGCTHRPSSFPRHFVVS